ncbi:MAG: DUF2961 domain-containing protein [Pirellulales bacterium]|nr:DUF2961 domain-containing protein [Pirellulales bacterium]
MRTLLPILAATLSIAIVDPAQAEITFAEHLRRMNDLDRLWLPPVPEDKCVQFASINPNSRKGYGAQEAQPGGPEGWYANADRNWYPRTETRAGKKEFVLADAAGPGAVVRIWSANPTGVLFFYIDGADEPTWSVDFKALTSGKIERLGEPLAGVRGKGYNCYLPIPFAKRLKLTCSQDDHHYHVNVCQYPADTTVESFRPALLEEHAALIDQTGKALLAGPSMEGTEVVSRRGTLAMDGDPDDPSEWTEVAIPLEGPLVVREIAVKIAPDASGKLDRANVLRRILLCVDLDDRRAVRVPVGDFFGSAPGFKPYRTFPMGVDDDGFGVCRFPMPIRGRGVVALVVDGPLPPVGFELCVRTQRQDVPDDALTFRASWHLRKQIRTRPFSDFRVLNAQGTGRFVGCCLVVANPSEFWWGEGDEKFFVDGESFPSTFGTGTEDYFGYAFADTDAFWSPQHAQPQCDGPGNASYTCLDRFHVLDAVPFQKSFLFDLEIWHWRDVYMDYAATAYWYGRPDADSGLPYVPDFRYRQVDPVPPERFFRAKNALEGESLKVLSATGTAEPTLEGWFTDRQWSGGQQLSWKDAKPGDKLALEVPVARAGAYRVEAVLSKSPDAGIVQCRLAGKPLGGPIDLFSPHVHMPTRRLDLGVVNLLAGPLALELELTGRNPRAGEACLVGLDYVRLVPVKDGAP